jgi:hypothetical protein
MILYKLCAFLVYIDGYSHAVRNNNITFFMYSIFYVVISGFSVSHNYCLCIIRSYARKKA